MKKTLIFFACALSAISLIAQAALPNDAKLSLSKNNIKVWTYPNSNTPVLAYQAETIMDATTERAIALVLDVIHAPNWVPNVMKTEILSRDDQKGEYVIYMVLDFPFPLKDRDMVIRSNISKDSQGIVSIKNKALTQGKALNPEYIRLKEYEGNWTFQRIADHKVKVMTSGYANPEGAIPAAVTNLLVQQQPYQMLQKMKAELKKPSKLPALPEILK